MSGEGVSHFTSLLSGLNFWKQIYLVVEKESEGSGREEGNRRTGEEVEQ